MIPQVEVLRLLRVSRQLSAMTHNGGPGGQCLGWRWAEVWAGKWPPWSRATEALAATFVHRLRRINSAASPLPTDLPPLNLLAPCAECEHSS
ncbi:Hypothetical protein SMAX5B_007764 [Scophthalmus maximus]|uniref:Uncharacterized protein n=1 Tax=Scophthalmus maximus TaxID=52904 RepID=A0A2U9B2A8_SCOMX|nr:Hypothetical protein SMAX5B_007764 [Scophthalmus maximus]